MSDELLLKACDTYSANIVKGPQSAMRAAIALIRAETLEEAASAMEQRTLRWRTIYAKQNNQKLAPCKDAAAIRALKEKST